MTDDPLNESIIAALPLPVMLVSQRYRIDHANAGAGEIFGQDLVGLNAATLLRQAPVLAAMDQAIRDGQPGQARFILSGHSGEVIYQVSANAIPGGAILSFEDASLRDENDIMRRDFIANISHELRTPLTGLIGFIETLKGPAKSDPEAQARFLDIMDREAQRMSRMVSDLLSLSRVEADERVRPREMVNLPGILRSAVATLEGKLKDARCEVAAEGIDGDIYVPGDRDQLIQLFLNLVENAIKYGGRDRTIHISCQEVERDPTLRQPVLRVEVRDEGEGIDPIHLPRLTERFYRVDDHRSREQGGTGLGLSIVKHIVNRHRGRLKITSEQGVGSCFAVIIPKFSGARNSSDPVS